MILKYQTVHLKWEDSFGHKLCFNKAMSKQINKQHCM